MANFPSLKTGAAAQYPLEREMRFSTQAVRFMDGSHQRFQLYGKALRRWTVKLDLLDEGELAAVIAFVEQEGRGVFAFADPVTGDNVAKCRVWGGEFNAAMVREMHGQATLLIEEIA